MGRAKVLWHTIAMHRFSSEPWVIQQFGLVQAQALWIFI